MGVYGPRSKKVKGPSDFLFYLVAALLSIVFVGMGYNVYRAFYP
jgi:hypothetical protein